MLKAQIARALHCPSDAKAEHGLLLLRDLDEPVDAAPADAGGAPAQDSTAPCTKHAEELDCDRIIAALRARLGCR